VSEFVHDQVSTSLSAADTRLSAALVHPKRIALGVVAALTALGWLSLALMSARAPSLWQVLCQPGGAAGPAGLALAAGMWSAMVLAMMLPTAGPMILTYAEIADTAARKREPVVSPMVLTAGYVMVWLGFALGAAVLQWTLASAGLSLEGALARAGGGALFIGAGLYQFSTLKRACLAVCQRPFPFFFANWTTEPRGVLRLGLTQGLHCLGCCWAMMALMFASGAMNPVWMAALGALMTIEKLATTPRVSEAMGIGFAAAGLALLASALMVGG
jgi:predicted metal-binding membrane protein